MASGIISTGKLLLVLGISSVLVLVLSMFLGPMFAIMKLGMTRDFLILLFPKGLLIFIFFVAIACYFYDLKEGDTHGL